MGADMPDKIRLGIVGAGWVAKERHLLALSALPEVKLEAIWSRRSENARQLATLFGVSRVAERWQDIIESAAVDAVVIATPPILHHLVALSAVQAGKHVLCQARLARNLQEAQEMTDAARQSGLVTALYPARPGLKGGETVRRLLHQEHFIGEIAEIRVTGLTMAEDDSYSWLSDPEVVGVNAMGLGMWVEVLNRWIGPAKTVAAVGKCHKKQRKDVRGNWQAATVPDSLAVAAELVCGATASYHFSTSAAAAPSQSIAVFGTRGTLHYDFFPDVL